MISLGRAGAMLVSQSGVVRLEAPRISAVNTVGCGDALLAGLLDGWACGLDDAESLKQAVAFGTAAALQEVAGVVDMRDVDKMRSGIDVVEYVNSPR